MGRSTHVKLRRALSQAWAGMTDLGLGTGTSGNLSVRAGKGFLVTPSGIPHDAISPDRIVFMDEDGSHEGDWLPSSEWRMHLDIYRERPQAAAVVHTHSVHATAVSCLGQDVPAFHYMIGVAGGASLRCARYATFGTEALSRNALEALTQRKACLLANHGMICFGASLDEALRLAVEIETLCKQYVIARELGDPVVLSDEEMQRVLERFESYGKQPLHGES